MIKRGSLIFLLVLFFPSAAFSKEFSYSTQPSFLVLRSPGDASGLFSVFLTTLGFLHFYEEEGWVGCRIDFGCNGLYYDAQKGPNWWSYYFDPVQFGATDDAQVKTVTHRQIHKFHKAAFKSMSRQEGYALIQRHVHLQPEIKQKVARYVDKNFKDFFVVGVHFRGTDKKREAGRVSFKKIFVEIRKAVDKLPSDGYKIFVATDEQQFLDEISTEFKDRILYIDAQRSTNGKPVHFADKDQYAIGEQAVMDCLLLSYTNFLVRTVSNLSFCTLYFNPTLPFVTVEEKKS